MQYLYSDLISYNKAAVDNKVYCSRCFFKLVQHICMQSICDVKCTCMFFVLVTCMHMYMYCVHYSFMCKNLCVRLHSMKEF